MSKIELQMAGIIDQHLPIEVGPDFIDCRCGQADLTPKILWADHLAEILTKEFDIRPKILNHIPIDWEDDL